jgi:hypothetical protein
MERSGYRATSWARDAIDIGIANASGQIGFMNFC